MKWIEVIKINVADNRRAAVESQIESIMLGLNGKTDEKADHLKLYRNLLDNDLSLHLCWTKGTAEPWGSKLGQCLTHLLKEAGLVSHSVWVEEKRGIRSRLSIAAPSPSHIATAVKIRKGRTPQQRT